MCINQGTCGWGFTYYRIMVNNGQKLPRLEKTGPKIKEWIIINYRNIENNWQNIFKK